VVIVNKVTYHQQETYLWVLVRLSPSIYISSICSCPTNEYELHTKTTEYLHTETKHAMTNSIRRKSITILRKPSKSI
jgi:hypothetical protein